VNLQKLAELLEVSLVSCRWRGRLFQKSSPAPEQMSYIPRFWSPFPQVVWLTQWSHGSETHSCNIRTLLQLPACVNTAMCTMAETYYLVNRSCNQFGDRCFATTGPTL